MTTNTPILPLDPLASRVSFVLVSSFHSFLFRILFRINSPQQQSAQRPAPAAAMIASKRKPSAEVQAAFETAETAPLLDYETPANSSSAALPESLFYGLSFPDVPTQAPVVNLPKPQPQPQQVYQQRKPEEFEQLPSAPVEQIRTQSPAVPEHTMTQQYQYQQHQHHQVQQQKAQEEDITADLSALYASMEPPVSAPMYPSLPSLKIDTDVRTQDTRTASTVRLATDAVGNEKLVQELLEENAKLSREVNDLRASLRVLVEDEAGSIPEATAASATAGAGSSSRTASYQHVASYDSDTSSEAEEQKTSQALAHSGAGVQPAATQRAETRLKYVCCGSCSQWLQAPVDKTFVYCPQCGSVNDCSSVERRNEEQQRQPAPARRLPTMPWYQQCFARLAQFGT